MTEIEFRDDIANYIKKNGFDAFLETKEGEELIKHRAGIELNQLKAGERRVIEEINNDNKQFKKSDILVLDFLRSSEKNYGGFFEYLKPKLGPGVLTAYGYVSEEFEKFHREYHKAEGEDQEWVLDNFVKWPKDAVDAARTFTQKEKNKITKKDILEALEKEDKDVKKFFTSDEGKKWLKGQMSGIKGKQLEGEELENFKNDTRIIDDTKEFIKNDKILKKNSEHIQKDKDKIQQTVEQFVSFEESKKVLKQDFKKLKVEKFLTSEEVTRYIAKKKGIRTDLRTDLVAKIAVIKERGFSTEEAEAILCGDILISKEERADALNKFNNQSNASVSLEEGLIDVYTKLATEEFLQANALHQKNTDFFLKSKIGINLIAFQAQHGEKNTDEVTKEIKKDFKKKETKRYVEMVIESSPSMKKHYHNELMESIEAHKLLNEIKGKNIVRELKSDKNINDFVNLAAVKEVINQHCVEELVKKEKENVRNALKNQGVSAFLESEIGMKYKENNELFKESRADLRKALEEVINNAKRAEERGEGVVREKEGERKDVYTKLPKNELQIGFEKGGGKVIENFLDSPIGESWVKLNTGKTFPDIHQKGESSNELKKELKKQLNEREINIDYLLDSPAGKELVEYNISRNDLKEGIEEAKKLEGGITNVFELPVIKEHLGKLPNEKEKKTFRTSMIIDLNLGTESFLDSKTGISFIEKNVEETHKKRKETIKEKGVEGFIESPDLKGAIEQSLSGGINLISKQNNMNSMLKDFMREDLLREKNTPDKEKEPQKRIFGKFTMEYFRRSAKREQNQGTGVSK